MRATVRRRIAWAAAALLAMSHAGATMPKRIVSMNVCTDHLALLLAAPGQLVSVTWLARDPWLNPAADMTAGLHINYGGAEEVLPLKADVVLAGTTTTRQTVFLMQRLGLNVVEVPYVQTLDDIPRNIRIVAAALGREAEGERLIAVVKADLARSAAPLQETSPSAALYGAGGRVAGYGSLPGSVARHAGYRNLGDELGAMGGSLSVEELLFAKPDLVVLSPPREDRPSLAQLTLDHPALDRDGDLNLITIPPAWWTCESPDVGKAAARLAAERRE